MKVRIPIRSVWPLCGICLALRGVFAEVVHVVKEPTGKAVQAAIDTCTAQGGGENITIANLRVKMLAEDKPDKRATMPWFSKKSTD